MVKVIIGPRGSGKTGRLIEALNQYAGDEAANVVLIQRGRRLDRMVNHRVRLVDIDEYPVASFAELTSFLAGISAMDYDLTDIYLDSLFKVANSSDLDEAIAFLAEMETFTQTQEIDLHVVISMDDKDVPDALRAYERGKL